MSGAALAQFYVGDVLEVLAQLPDDSVDLVLTSPPFLALRSYLPADHADKAKEMGSEATPGEFIDALLDVIEAARRVLAPHGSIVFELGDTYAGSGGAGGDYGTLDPGAKPLRDGQPKFEGSAIASRRTRPANRPSGERTKAKTSRHNQPDGPPRTGRRYRSPEEPDVVGSVPKPLSPSPKFQGRRQSPDHDGAPIRDRDADEEAGIIPRRSHTRRELDGWPLDKSLCMIPELLRVALVYGFNPLTGRLTPRWRGRNVVRWCRPNPPVGQLHDKVRPGTSDMIVACPGRRRYWDGEAIRVQRSPNSHARTAKGVERRENDTPKAGSGGNNNRDSLGIEHLNDSAPPLDHWWDEPDDTFDQDAWLVSTEAYRGSHYATWPSALLTRHILAMCPQRVCRTCGEPSRRITEPSPEHAKYLGSDMYGRGQLDPETRDAKGLNGRTRMDREARGRRGSTGADGARPGICAEYLTVGWSDCGHDDWRPGVVLDPFAGSGTTLAVAVGHGRGAVGIDLDERNAELARERVGMFLEVVDRVAEEAG